MISAHPHHVLLWAAVILAFLVWQGVQSLQTRTLPIWRLFLTPAVFITLGLARVFASLHEGPQAGLAWLLASAFGAPFALAYAPKILAVDRRRASVTRAGSPIPLVRNVIVFALQAGSAAMAAIPQAASWRIVLSCAISGASAGYFLGWIALAIRAFING